jgi:hypothetical protein
MPSPFANEETNRPPIARGTSGHCIYSHFFQRKSIYGPIAAKAINMIASG